MLGFVGAELPVDALLFSGISISTPSKITQVGIVGNLNTTASPSTPVTTVYLKVKLIVKHLDSKMGSQKSNKNLFFSTYLST